MIQRYLENVQNVFKSFFFRFSFNRSLVIFEFLRVRLPTTHHLNKLYTFAESWKSLKIHRLQVDRNRKRDVISISVKAYDSYRMSDTVWVIRSEAPARQGKGEGFYSYRQKDFGLIDTELFLIHSSLEKNRLWYTKFADQKSKKPITHFQLI